MAQSVAQAVGVTAQSLRVYSAGVSARCLVYSGRRRISATVVWFVDCRHIGAISIAIAGIAALLVCRWYMAVRCERRVVIVVERRARLSVGR